MTISEAIKCIITFYPFNIEPIKILCWAIMINFVGSLPPTDPAVELNIKGAHLQAIIRKSSLLLAPNLDPFKVTNNLKISLKNTSNLKIDL